jgi:hypothetical protein
MSECGGERIVQVLLKNGDYWDVGLESAVSESSGQTIMIGAACILDSANGHGDERLCQLAQRHGWPFSLNDLVDPLLYAEQYMNEQIDHEGTERAACTPGPGGRMRGSSHGPWSFGWVEGDFILANAMWWEYNAC